MRCAGVNRLRKSYYKMVQVRYNNTMEVINNTLQRNARQDYH